MNKTTLLVLVFSPFAAVLAIKFALDPTWLRQWTLMECVALGAGIGLFGGFAAAAAGRE